MKQFFLASLLFCFSLSAVSFETISFITPRGNKCAVEPITTADAYDLATKIAGSDFRAPVSDTEKSRSCLSGLDFDPHYNRAQLFLIALEDEIVGIMTMLILPSAQLSKLGCLIKKTDKLVLNSLSDELDLGRDGFSITPGWFSVPFLHARDEIVHSIGEQAITPIINTILKEAPPETPISIAYSRIQKENGFLWPMFAKKWAGYLLENKSPLIDLTPNLKELLESEKNDTFSLNLIKLFNLKKTNVCNFTLGSYHIKKIQ